MVSVWIPALIWLAVIACESTLLSTGETSRFILPLLHFLLPHGSEQQITFLHALLRKAGHFTGYSILSLLLYRAWWGTMVLQQSPAGTRRAPGWKRMLELWNGRVALLAWLGTVLVAALDELQQSLHANRTSSFKDVLLDSAGGLCVQMLILAASSGRMRTHYDPAADRKAEPRAGMRRSTPERADRPAESSSGTSAP